MSESMKNVMYISYNEQIGVLCDNEKEVVSQVIGTDLTLVYEKKERKSYLLVPLTKNHTFECKGDDIIVDGKPAHSGYYFRKDGCQWIQITNEDTLRLAV